MPKATLFSKTHDAAHKHSIASNSFGRQIPASLLPESYNLNDLNAYLHSVEKSSLDETLAAFKVLEASLNHERFHRTKYDVLSASILFDQIEALLKPDASIFAEGHSNSSENDGSRKQWQLQSLLGLRILSRLLELYSEETSPRTTLLLTLIALTNVNDSWSSSETSELAAQLLCRHGQRAFTDKFITQEILAEYIRPLFKNSKPMTVTEQGRKQTVESLPNQRLFASPLFDPVRKPWKFREIGSITAFRWAIEKADKELMAKNWHLYIPPLLTLLDEANTSIRLSGMAALSGFLDKVPPQLLEQTGLGGVMEEALIPTLSFLPTLTPANESLLLLDAAYGTMLKLADVRFGDQNSQLKKHKMMDKLLHEGVLRGMDHCSQHAEIMRLLLAVLGKVITRLEIRSVKYLKDITPLLYNQLMDPFAPTNPENLTQAVQALQIVVLNSWPVLSEDRHRIDVLKAISICWLHVSDDILGNKTFANGQLLKAQNDLKTTAALLSQVMPDTGTFSKEVEQLIGAEPKVASLFR